MTPHLVPYLEPAVEAEVATACIEQYQRTLALLRCESGYADRSLADLLGDAGADAVALACADALKGALREALGERLEATP